MKITRHITRHTFFRYIQKHIDSRSNVIQKSKWRRSAEFKKPQMPDDVIDNLVETALTRLECYEPELKKAIKQYRFYSISPSGDRLVAYADNKLKLINELLLDPQNETILKELVDLHSTK